ncbi:hypothetical protein CPB85DRAFT_1308246 [Mucidula mucida]|nr:hypothetical protein CPB85DRAFT_1308246 [Mucidula mucida]
MDIPGRPPPNDTGQRRGNRRPRRDNGANTAVDNQLPSGPRNGGLENPTKPPRVRTNRHKPRPAADGAADGAPSSSNPSSNGNGGQANRRPKPKPLRPTEGAADSSAQPQPKTSRRPRFNGGLTGPSEGGSSHSHRKEKYKLPDASADDLTSTLIRSLSVAPYADCPICFSSIHPAQPTWSCSPTMPVIDEDPQYCWTTFHLKCIRSWSEKSYKEIKEAWRARCQGKRNVLVGGYRCFCGSTPSPNARLATPHSCGNPCSRSKNACPHPCPLSCHPGPCPPCKVMLEIPCKCPRARIVPVRCGEDIRVSCGETCGRDLNCSKHKCQKPCHLGPCGDCQEVVNQKCWCGDEMRKTACGAGDKWLVGVGCEREGPLIDSLGWSCAKSCHRNYDCGKHFCDKACHPPTLGSSPCPLSPSNVKTCPCGKKRIGADFPVRASCEDPIPTCQSTCGTPRSTCEHLCQAKCHADECPPCNELVVRPCRCGNVRRSIACGNLHVTVEEAGITIEVPVLCDKPCTALRACGRHRCNRVCCPLASFTSAKNKGKKRGVEPAEIGEEPGGMHECDLVCGKMLSCGNHRCEDRDHRGPCAPCLRSSFEELICFCGRTVLEPPVPCGTKIQCTYPCVFPPPECGHPKTPHVCHGDDVSCPPCPFLTTKLCACGAKMVGNVRCSLDRDKIGCGTACGKLLECGFHHCERVCHADECGTCTMPCGKPRKMCLPGHHPCTEPCHAPSACSEKEPCQTIISLSCPCGRIKQSIRCGRSTTNASGRSDVLKCTSECEIAKRNARLADALGINTASRDKNPGGPPVYSDELLGFARLNDKFLSVAEKAFAEFVSSGRKTQVLPQMPVERRKFVIELAGVYRMDYRMVDQEPHRSVELIRRIDTRIPAPLLSAQALAGSRPNLGKLGNLRAAPVAGVQKPSAPLSRGWATPAGGGSRAATPPSRTAELPATQSTSAEVRRPVGSVYRPPGARQVVQAPAPSVGVTDVDVPDNWEDDA